MRPYRNAGLVGSVGASQSGRVGPGPKEELHEKQPYPWMQVPLSSRLAGWKPKTLCQFPQEARTGCSTRQTN